MTFISYHILITIGKQWTLSGSITHQVTVVWSCTFDLWVISLWFDEWRICFVVRLWAPSDRHTPYPRLQVIHSHRCQLASTASLILPQKGGIRGAAKQSPLPCGKSPHDCRTERAVWLGLHNTHLLKKTQKRPFLWQKFRLTSGVRLNVNFYRGSIESILTGNIPNQYGLWRAKNFTGTQRQSNSNTSEVRCLHRAQRTKTTITPTTVCCNVSISCHTIRQQSSFIPQAAGLLNSTSRPHRLKKDVAGLKLYVFFKPLILEFAVYLS